MFSTFLKVRSFNLLQPYFTPSAVQQLHQKKREKEKEIESKMNTEFDQQFLCYFKKRKNKLAQNHDCLSETISNYFILFFILVVLGIEFIQ